MNVHTHTYIVMTFILSHLKVQASMIYLLLYLILEYTEIRVRIISLYHRKKTTVQYLFLVL